MEPRRIAFILVLIGILLLVIPAMAAYTGPCPIGTNGAPALIDPGLSSGAKCRDACGQDCPDERCDLLVDSGGAAMPLIVTIENPRGICTYNNVLECPTHSGCQIHDDCFDKCTETLGMYSMTDSCHMSCNKDCVSKYGLTNCVLWTDAPTIIYDSQFTSAMGYIMDHTSGVDFSGYLFFSNEPVFTPKPLTTTVTPTVTPEESTDTEPADENKPPFEIPDILKEKPNIQYIVDDYKKAGDDARRKGNYELAIQYYDAAEAFLVRDFKDKASRPASVDEQLSSLEGDKVVVYSNWPGHEEERTEAKKNSKDLLASAESKKQKSSFDLPGFEVVPCVMALCLLFIIWRRKK
jgi:hypothetical protein